MRPLNKILKNLFFVIAILGSLYNSKEAVAQKISGQEFWFTLPRMSPLDENAEGLFLYIVSDYCIEDAYVEAPHLNWRVDFTVDRGQYTQIKVPTRVSGGTPIYHDRPNRVEKKGIFLKADFPVVVYAVTYESASVDGEIILPVDKLDDEYVLSTRGIMVLGQLRNTVVATEDSTDIEIDTWDNNDNPITIDIILNQGETYQWSKTRQNCTADYPRRPYRDCATLNGTVVKASKPVAVIGSVDCSGGNECGACENTFITYQPNKRWGTEHVTAQVIPRQDPNLAVTCGGAGDVSGDYIEVLGEVGTKVTINDYRGDRTVTLAAPAYDNGAGYGYGYTFFEVPRNPAGGDFGFANTVITSDKPVQVTQHPKGWQTDNVGASDPEAIMVFPTDLWVDSYIFAILRTATTTNNDFTIIMEDVGGSLNQVEFDDGVSTRNINAIPGATAWMKIGTSNYFYKRVPVPISTNTLRIYSRTNTPFGIYTASRGQAESYVQNGGDGPILEIPTCPICPIAEFQKKEDVCIGVEAEFIDMSEDNDASGSTSINEWVWDYGDGQRDTFNVSTNPKHIYTAPGVYEVTLYVTNDNPNPGPCTIEITKLITVFDGPNANAGPDQTICFGEPVVLGGSPTGSGGEAPLTYNWKPSTGIANTSSPNPSAYPPSDEEYIVEVEDADGCIQRDTTLITVQPKDSAYIADDEYTVCKGDEVPVEISISGGNSTTYSITLSNGTSSVTETALPSNGGVVLVPFNTGFPNGFNVRITAFSANDPGICAVFDVGQIPVKVRNKPDPTFEVNSIDICEGDQATVNINFSADGSLSFDISDGTDVDSYSNISANPYQLIVAPTVTTTYTISNVRHSDDPTCPSTKTSAVTVNVLQDKDPGEDGFLKICSGGGLVDLFSLLGGTPDAGGDWRDITFSGALVGDKFDPSLATDGEYEFEYAVSAGPNCNELTSIVKIDFNEPPKFRDLVEDCSEQLLDYKVKFTAFGGDPATYSSPDGTFTPGGVSRDFTSTNDYPTKSNYSISFDDANGCGPVVISGFKNCGCFTNAGTMNTAPLEYCETDMAMPQFNDDSVLVKRENDPNDTLYFVLHRGSALNIVDPIDSFPTPQFAFDAAKMNYGTTYYLSPVAGEPNGQGGIDYDPQGCVSVGQGTPIKFFKQPTVTASAVTPDICTGDQAAIRVQFTGAAPYAVTLFDEDGTTELSFTNLDATDTIYVTPSQTHTYQFKDIDGKYCKDVPVSQTVTITTHEAPDSIPGTLTYTCTRAADFYTVEIQLSGDAGSMKVAPSSAGTIDPATGIFTSNPIANNTPYTFTFSDQYKCGNFVLTDQYDCPCVTAAGTFVEDTVSVCAYDIASFTHNQDSVIDPDDDHVFIVYTDLNNPTGTILLTKKTASFPIQAPLQPDTRYYVSLAMGNQNGSGGVNYNDPCLDISPPVVLYFNGIPSAEFRGDPDIDLCAGEEFKFPFDLQGNGPFTLRYNFSNDNNSGESSVTLATTPTDTFKISPTLKEEYEFFEVIDVNGCIAPMDTTVVADVKASPSIEITNVLDTTVCKGEEVEIRLAAEFNGRFSYELWDGYTNTMIRRFPIKVSKAFSYKFDMTDDSLLVEPRNIEDDVCTGVSSGAKKVYGTELPQLTFNSAADVCEGNAAQVSFSITGGVAPYSIRVTGPNNYDQTFNNLVANDAIALPGDNAGTFTYTAVEVTDSSPIKACVGSGNSVTYTVNPLPEATIIEAQDVCKGNEIPLTFDIQGTGNDFSLQITNSDGLDTIIYNLPAGRTTLNMPGSSSNNVVYNLGTVTDVLGCSDVGSGSDNSVQFDSPTIDFDFNKTNDDCYPLQLSVNPQIVAPGNSTCTWTFEDGTVVSGCDDPFNVTLYQVGDLDMAVRVRTPTGCGADSLFVDTIHVRPNPRASFGFNPKIPTNLLNVVDFNNTTINGDRYIWKIDTLAVLNTTNPQYEFPTTPNKTYNVWLVAYTDFGCVDSTNKLIEVVPDLDIYIPNSFSPNGDGVNETFRPVLTLSPEDVIEYEFYVFNRWGELLFYTQDMFGAWDGDYKGEQVPIGVYTYRVRAKVGANAVTLDRRGTVNVIH
ncbi:PKD domain-containing protein [Luteibaculum oceani]|uniref:T9SS type B sorting domain-containing protein n=1 Tax=Luteibaculum oceani TaxID=1294296 RepID=A0A5C6V1N9_9FLAO|nr:PKD domain-containing protein [Luteibaculum oceani]TXC78914.1 T9SS type B sorting domain-containing protein [Luteibaculum oceani]